MSMDLIMLNLLVIWFGVAFGIFKFTGII